MGQGLACYDCCWYSSLHSNVGVSINMLFCSAWCCMPKEMYDLRGPGCLHVGSCDHGWGSSFFCEGTICFAPLWLRDYSLWQTIGQSRQLYNLRIDHLENQQTLGYGVPQQPGYFP